MSDVRVLVFSLCTIACITAACGRTGLDQGFDTTNVTAGNAGAAVGVSGIGNGESGAAGNVGDTSGQGGGAGNSARPPTAMAIPCGDSACTPGAQICCLQRGRRRDSATCIDANASCDSGASIGCLTAASCGAGQVCCESLLAAATMCVAPGDCFTEPGIILCQSSADCPPSASHCCDAEGSGVCAAQRCPSGGGQRGPGGDGAGGPQD